MLSRVYILLLLLISIALTGPLDAQAQITPDEQIHHDIVLVIDCSGSMRQNDPLQLRLAAAKLFIDLAEIGDRIGIVVMSDQAHTRSLMRRMVRITDQKDVKSLKDLIESLRTEPLGNETHMATALADAYELLEDTATDPRGPNEEQFTVLLTDGRPTGQGKDENGQNRQQGDLVKQVTAQFQARGYRKIFSIALGRDADRAFLEQYVSPNPNGAVFVAKTAEELLDRYLEVYAQLGEDRFIDRTAIPTNTLVRFATIQPDQGLTQFSVVVPGDPQTIVRELRAPGGQDLVNPTYEGTVRRAAEAEYTVYTLSSNSSIGLTGAWSIHVERPGGANQPLILLSRSRLRARLIVPSGDDDGGTYCVPIGRPFVVIAGGQLPMPHTRQQPGQLPALAWAQFTSGSPTIQISGAAPSTTLTLKDDGQKYDMATNDGRYSGIYPAITAPGKYVLRLEFPYQDMPVHVFKDFEICATNLPAPLINLAPATQPLPVGAPLRAYPET